jgi:hypothetical protein
MLPFKPIPRLLIVVYAAKANAADIVRDRIRGHQQRYFCICWESPVWKNREFETGETVRQSFPHPLVSPSIYCNEGQHEAQDATWMQIIEHTRQQFCRFEH